MTGNDVAWAFLAVTIALCWLAEYRTRRQLERDLIDADSLIYGLALVPDACSRPAHPYPGEITYRSNK